VKVQAELKPALKDSTNPHFKASYADLTSVVGVSRSLLTDNGLVVTQPLTVDGDNVTLVTQVTHESGQWMRSSYPVKAMKPDPQTLGSAVTYARRYAYCALVGVVTDDDDDGNAASEKPAKEKSIFETPELRATYVENCVSAISRVSNGQEFKDQKDLNAAKWNALKAATDKGDKDAWAGIAKAYNDKHAELKAAAEQKPKTVSQAKKVDAALDNDSIEY
jgi:hypothetical protein